MPIAGLYLIMHTIENRSNAAHSYRKSNNLYVFSQQKLPMQKLWLMAIMLLLMSSCGPEPRKAQQKIEEGKIFTIQANYKMAIDAFDQAIEYDPSSYEAYFQRGSAYFNTRNYKKAVEDFLKAVELNPGYADAWFNLGQIMEIEMDQEMACYYFKKAQEYGRANIGDYLRKCPQ
jgi:tetratricopeptide (TPR) repeat protein